MIWHTSYKTPRCDVGRAPSPAQCAFGGWRRRRWIAAAIGRGATLIVPLLASSIAYAQCNIPNPAPTLQPLDSNFANQTFLASNGTSYVLQNSGIPGCPGGPGGAGQNGGPGFVGQPGGELSSTNTNITLGAGFTNPLNFLVSGAFIAADGGAGGAGGASGSVDSSSVIGGNGLGGGAGGQITVQFSGTAVAMPNPPDIGLYLSAQGGVGGAGGDSSPAGIFIKQGGVGGDGGAGGSITLTGSGNIAAPGNGFNFGILGFATGGFGGAGGNVRLDANSDLFDKIIGGAGGNGNAGGTVNIHWQSGAIFANGNAIVADADGGGGGGGGQTSASVENQGGNGGNGGNGGSANITLGAGATASVTIPSNEFPSAATVVVSANGGAGAAGGPIGTALGSAGGSGGNGGTGGSASATIAGTVSYNSQILDASPPSPFNFVSGGQAVLVQANGGGGGLGGDTNALVGHAGGGGLAASGGSATLTLGDATGRATITTLGSSTQGVLVQSIGGGGGTGGNTSFGGFGGAGAAGGDGGAVTVNAPNASVIAQSDKSIAFLAQSIGGGGGAGGDANNIAIGAEIAIGGNGGLGGNGSTVQLTLGPSVFASLGTLGGAGVLAQSIGGSGGSAGSASSQGVGLIAMAIGGDAGSGGSAGPVSITSSSLVTTFGDHAAGIEAQSIGGGGGKGGSAFSFVGGLVPVGSVAVGGRGGGGGPGGNVSITNAGQITTYGADAYGVLMQSIGGGGGTGGAAAARAVSLSPSKFIPAISVSVSLGGSGGAGNTAGTVNLDNSGLVTTAGDGASAVIAQSIGGGGGTAGDATAASYSAGSQAGLAISVSVAVGGSGGSGGTGNTVTVTNEGLIATLGQDAYGVLAQSIGGGGGNGGTGDATAAANNAKQSFSASIAVGGTGGTGGNAGAVSLGNSGSITTRGDGADAVFAQSVGGGGGTGGGGTATAAGGNLAIAVGVGGNGGAGGNGNTVSATNSGGIVTRGTAATGMLVQSIGGGGGKAGKGGATAGGVSTLSNAQALFDIMGQGLGLSENVQNIGNGILQIGQVGEDIKASYDELNGILSQPQSDPNSEEGTATQINVGVSVGGRGGAAGQGGAVTATNSGAITTYGAQSHGIFAQSVGGGGGDGGAASSTGSASDDSQVQSAVAVGGTGGAAGSGGPVTVVNGPGGTIVTQGVAAFGIYAQSIGGGGGNGALAGVVSGSLKSLSVGVGGNGGGAGDGGVVSVTTGDGTSDSTIQTMGKHGIGILAQSVGGGGGVVTTMTTDETFDPSKILVNPQGRVADIHGLSLTFGGQNGSSGKGGEVDVTASGNVITQGLDAHAVIAQSIGGGGGLVVGGQVNLPAGGTGGAGGAGGDGGPVNVKVQSGATIETALDGAFGVIAQSIGGGGGFAGDPSVVQTYQPGTGFAIKANSGNGGTVSVSVDNAAILTTGNYAPAIFAQSIGGGGGLETYNIAGGAQQVQARGTAGGSGIGGAVTVALANGARVYALGAGSAGIIAQSDGTSSGAIQISIDGSSTVQGGRADPNAPPGQSADQRDAAAIRLLGGTNNHVTNAGSITALGQYAILANSAASNTTLTNTGSITGDVDLGSSGTSVVDNLRGGVMSIPTTLNVGGGTVNNAGALYVGGARAIGTTVLNGNFVQTSNGELHVEIDPVNKRSDLLSVTGTASLAGTVVVNAMSLLKGSSTVLTAAGGIQPGASLAGASRLIFTFTPVVQSNTVAVATDADFVGASNGSANQKSVAAHLQRLWDSADPGFASIFAPFGNIGSASNYAQALTSVSGQELVGIAAARYQASQIFARSAFSCPVFVDDTTVRKQDSCVWFRATGMWDNRSADGSFPGFAWQGTTVKVGGQAELQPGWFLGGALGYEIDNFSANNSLTSAHGNAVLGVVALKHEVGPWILTGAVDAGIGWLNSSRNIPIAAAVATASSDSFNVGLHLRAAYQIPFDRFYLEPALDGDLNDINLPGYTESGAGVFDLKVRTANNVIATGTPNLRVGTRLQVGSATLDAYLGAGVSFIAGNNYTTNAHFVAASGFGDFTNTLPNAHVAGKFSAGMELYTTSHFDLRLEYDGLVAAHQTENGGQIRLSYRF